MKASIAIRTRQYRSIVRVIIPMCLLLMIVFAAPLSARDGSGEQKTEIELKTPRLGNHKFLSNRLIRGPFITTHIRNTLGIGKAINLRLPVLVFQGDTLLGLEGDLLFSILEFQYQHAVKDWLAVYGQFEVVGKLGTGVQSILAQGISAGTGFELGWMFRLLQSERSMLSGTLNLWNSSGTVINLSDFINGIIEDGGIRPDNELVRKRPFMRGGGGLRFAWAASELIGVTLLGEAAYGESIDRREDNRLYFKLGGALDFDLASRTAVPLGISLAYLFDTFPSGGDNTIDDNLRTLLLRIAYTGREDFLIGLDLTWQRLPLRQLDQTLNNGSTVINMRYFF